MNDRLIDRLEKVNVGFNWVFKKLHNSKMNVKGSKTNRRFVVLKGVAE